MKEYNMCFSNESIWHDMKVDMSWVWQNRQRPMRRCVFPTSCNAKISSCGWSRWAKVKEDKLHELPHVAFLTNKYGEAKQKWRKHDMNTTWTRHEHDMNTTCAEMAGKCADVWTMAQYGNVWHIKYGRIRSNELYLSWRYSAAGQSHKEQYGSLVFLGLQKNFIGAFFEGPRACSFLLARGGGTLKPSDWLGQQLLFILIADLKQLWQQNNSENEPWYQEICEVFVFHVWNLTQFLEETQGLPSLTGRRKHGL